MAGATFLVRRPQYRVHVGREGVRSGDAYAHSWLDRSAQLINSLPWSREDSHVRHVLTYSSVRVVTRRLRRVAHGQRADVANQFAGQTTQDEQTRIKEAGCS